MNVRVIPMEKSRSVIIVRLVILRWGHDVGLWMLGIAIKVRTRIITLGKETKIEIANVIGIRREQVNGLSTQFLLSLLVDNMAFLDR